MGTKAMTHDNVTDIVGRLRGYGKDQHSWRSQAEREAAALIEAQQTELATLRKQLENARSEALEEAAKAIRDEQDRLDAEAGDYLMDPTDCIDVIEALKVPQ